MCYNSKKKRGAFILDEEFLEIAKRVRELRESCGYTVEQLANEIGIDAKQYEQYEANGADFPIGLIYQIASKFGVDFSEIVSGVNPKLDTYHIVRAGEGISVNRYPGYQVQDLAFRFHKKDMQPFLVILDPSKEPAKLVSHAGQEFNLVLEGSMVVVFEEKEFTLNVGDSIYFNPTHMHGQKCAGDRVTKFLTVVTK